MFALVNRHAEQQRTAQVATLTQAARSMMQAVDSQVIRRQSVLEGLLTSDAARRRDFHALYQRMQQLLARPGLASRFSIIDKTGQLLANTTVPYGQPMPRHGNPAHMEALIRSKRPQVSGLFMGMVNGDPVVTVSVPVIFDDAVDYVLSATLTPDSLAPILRSAGFPPAWRVALLDQEGKFIVRMQGNQAAAFGERNEVLWRGIKNIPDGAFEATTLEGDRILAVYSRSEVTGWTVVFGIPMEPLEAEYQKPLYWLLAGIGLLFGLVVSLAWWMSGRIASSIQALLPPAQQLGEGRQVALVEVHVEEAAGVALALVNASDVLKQRSEALEAERNDRLRQLEEMVAERTEALEAAMKASESLARHDVLTGLLNRLAANERLQELATRHHQCRRVRGTSDGSQRP